MGAINELFRVKELLIYFFFILSKKNTPKSAKRFGVNRNLVAAYYFFPYFLEI